MLSQLVTFAQAPDRHLDSADPSPGSGTSTSDGNDADGLGDLSRDLLLLGVNCMVNRREPLDVGVERSDRVGVSIMPVCYFLLQISPGQPT